MKPRPVLKVDPIGCTAHGLCAELMPELIRLDDWGYPIIKDGPVPVKLLELARRTVTACPALALRIDQEYTPAR